MFLYFFPVIIINVLKKLKFQTIVLGIQVHTSTMYLDETEEPPTRLGVLSENLLKIWSTKIGLKCISQPVVRPFYKPSVKTFWLNFQVPIPMKQYKNTSGYNTAWETFFSHQHST